MLESQGVLAVKPGPGGGIIVGSPSIDLLAHGLSVFLRLNEVPFITVLKAREVIEPALAREAALHATDEDFAELEQSIARMKSLPADVDQVVFLAENRQFHRIITRASGNKVLEAFWSTITVLEGEELRDIRFSVSNQAHVTEAHERILAACRARDGDGDREGDRAAQPRCRTGSEGTDERSVQPRGGRPVRCRACGHRFTHRSTKPA